MEEKLISAKSYWTREEAEAYDRSTSTRKVQHMMTEKLLKEMKTGGRTLDIGCGTGFSMEVTGKESFGMDISIEMLKLARKKGFERLVLADFRHIPFKDNSFDIIISVSTIQWVTGKEPQEIIDQYRSVFNEMKRVLKAGGKAGLQFYPHTEKEFKIVKKQLSKMFSGHVLEEGEGKKKKRYFILKNSS